LLLLQSADSRIGRSTIVSGCIGCMGQLVQESKERGRLADESPIAVRGAHC